MGRTWYCVVLRVSDEPSINFRDDQVVTKCFLYFRSITLCCGDLNLNIFPHCVKE